MGESVPEGNVPPMLLASGGSKRVPKPRVKPAQAEASAEIEPAASPVPTAAVPAESDPKEETMATVINETADKATDTAMNSATFTADAAKTVGTDAVQKGMKFVEEINSFAKGNAEAMVEASKIVARGAEDIAKYTTDYARGSVEKANERARRIAAVKSPAELLQLQTELARETMDAVAQETSKFAENYLKLLGEIAQPFQNRFALAAEKMKIVA